MERRTILKQFVFVAGAAFVFPACLGDGLGSRFNLVNFTISRTEELMLWELSEMLIPESSTPGAKSLDLYRFALKMIDECCSKLEQGYFSEGVSILNRMIRESFDRPLSKCNHDEKARILSFLEMSQQNPPIRQFYVLFKKQIINGYVNSEFFMTEIVRYELVPGRYTVHYKVS